MASRYAAARASRALEWRPLAEVAQQAALERRIADGALRAAAHTPEALIGGLDREAVRMLVTAGMACSALHTESRVASAVGEVRSPPLRPPNARPGASVSWWIGRYASPCLS